MYMFRMHSIGSVRPRLFNPPLSRPPQMQQLQQLQPEEQEEPEKQAEQEEQEEQAEELKEKEEDIPQPRCVEPETTVSAPWPKNKKNRSANDGNPSPSF